MRTTLLMVAVLLCWESAAATPLTKEDHAFLANKTMEGCLSGQARQAANQNLTVGKIQDFCRCFGEGLASTMQVEDLANNQETASPELTKASGVISTKCAVTILGK